MSSRPIPTSDLAARFPGLRALASDYVNLEWDYEYDSAQEAVLAFAREHPELVQSCLAGVVFVLHSCPDETARLRELDRVGWGFAGRPGALDTFLNWTRQTLEGESEAGSRPHDL